MVKLDALAIFYNAAKRKLVRMIFNVGTFA